MPASDEAFPGRDDPETGEHEPNPSTVTNPGHYEALAAAAEELGQLSEQVDGVPVDGDHGFRRPPTPESRDHGPDN